jgi:hypothetical protein
VLDMGFARHIANAMLSAVVICRLRSP